MKPNRPVSSQDPGDNTAKCFWMLAGIVDYKLCDLHFACETCPFEQAMHNRPAQQPSPGPADSGLFFHPRHVWARVEAGGRVRTGLDVFGSRLAGQIYCVQLPAPGTRVTSGAPAWSAVHHEGEIDLAAPVSGVVMEVNEKLLVNPGLVTQDPYGEGWAVVISPTALVDDLVGLCFGKAAEPWLSAESQRLGGELTRVAGAAATLPDGGRLVANLHDAIPQEHRVRILNLFLSASEGPTVRFRRERVG
jgi:glycine cleavage system H protein